MSQPPASPPDPPAENPFIRYPDVLLADTIGDLTAQKKTIEDRLKLGFSEMDRRHRRSLDGLRFAISKGVEKINRLDTKGLKKKFGEAWYAGWVKPGTRTKWTVTQLPPPEVGAEL